jgi:hypothetical protein
MFTFGSDNQWSVVAWGAKFFIKVIKIYAQYDTVF